MPAPLAIAPKWKALPRMGYGIVVYPFRPLPDTQFALSPAANGATAARPSSSSSKREVTFNGPATAGNGMDIAAQQLSLDLGDEVYVFEQAEGWYRGYVVTSVTPPVVLSSSSSSSAHGPKIATEVKGLMDPKVYVGIFPANYVAVKEYVSDALGILANGDEEDDEYNSANASKRSSYLSATTNRRDASASAPATPTIATFPGLPLHRIADKLQAPKRNLSTSSRKTEKSRASRGGKNSIIQRTPPLPALKVGDDTEAGLEEPLVDEVSAALREWHGLLFGIFLKKNYRLFDDLSGLILKLERARRDLLSGLLTKSETIQLRREIVVMLNIGNKMLPGRPIKGPC
jgi:dedicator of cytokinesis protein 3